MLPTFIQVDTCGSTYHLLKFRQKFVIISFLMYLGEAVYTTYVFLALLGHLSELYILGKLYVF